jgi:hypothetical protein
VRTIDPQTPAEQAAYAKWLDQTSDRETARQDRIHGAVGVIPLPLWIILLTISAIIFVYMLFFADSGEGWGAQAMLMGSATTVIVLTLTAISALGHPYRSGQGQIQPVAMERSLELLHAARRVVNQTAPLPCDARGVAT